MIEKLKLWIDANGGIMLSVGIMNAAIASGLYAAQKGLGWMKDRTKWEGDNKLYNFVGKAIGFSEKVARILAGNAPTKEHTDAIKKDEPVSPQG